MKKIILLFLIVFSVQAFAESQNGVIYVTPNGTGSGESWSDAMGDIQQAISLARSQDPEARKDVWVAAGEYEISTAINVIDSVNVYGSFVGTETAVYERPRPENAKGWEFSNPTVLKANGSRLFQAAGHLDMETVVDGFVMQDGNGGGSALNNSGGAVVARDNVVYQNCIMRNNTATGAGGGVMMTGGTIRYCLIENNTHTTGANGGGGIFSNPPVGYISYIEHSVIRGNSSTIRGAGIGVQGAEMTYVSNVEIYNNIAVDGTTLKAGGAVYSNSANNRIINSFIYNNSGATAIYYNGGNLFNNTIVKNVGGLYLAGNVVNAYNNIVWGCATDNTGTTATSITGTANSSWKVKHNATYNPVPTDKGWDIDENFEFSSNNSNGDVEDPRPGSVGSGPKFIKVSSFIGVADSEEETLSLDSVLWQLNTLSPCVDAGMPVESVEEDLYGTLRPQGFPKDEALYDIGAYELPFYTVVVGEADDANGTIYSSLGQVITENSVFGYAKGSKIELYFEPAVGYKLGAAYYTISNDEGLSFEGERVEFTDELDEDFFWTATVNNSFKIEVDWESETGLKRLDSSLIQCYSRDNQIFISGLKPMEKVYIYDTVGKLVKEVVSNEGLTSINILSGIYIVHTSEGVQKLIVQ